MELDDALYARLTAATDRGNALAEAGRLEEAVAAFASALTMLPEPVEDWEAATFILASAGDCLFMLGRFTEARQSLTRAMGCPGALGNPFIHLRLGQAQFELGNLDRAKDELARAYMGAGSEIFAKENPKYLAFLRQHMQGI
jgi:tetratricopeptide (TPR) repeat protein